jgi:homoserine/homoserine lactone efflux protein
MVFSNSFTCRINLSLSFVSALGWLIVFLLAVLPQFLDLSKPQWSQYVVMAVTMVAIDLIVMAGYTGLAAKVLKLLKSPRQQKYLNRTFAVLFSCAAGLLSLVHQ